MLCNYNLDAGYFIYLVLEQWQFLVHVSGNSVVILKHVRLGIVIVNQ